MAGPYSTINEFITALLPGCREVQSKYGIFVSSMLSQAITETSGTSYLLKVDNNAFGIQYPGPKDLALGVTEGSIVGDGAGNGKLHYRHYNSLNDSCLDFGYFLKNGASYKAAFSAKTPEDQVKAIAAGGYAEEGKYDVDCISNMNTYNLKQYDTGTFNGGDSANSQSEGITIEATNYQVVANSEKKGDVLFGRRYRITVSDDSGNALDVSDLHCTFNIVKTILMEPNTSEVSIYNLNVHTENSIIMNGKRLTVEAGYEGSQFGLIFDGDILQTIREREDGTTCKLTIIALDSDRAINFEIVNCSIAKGQTMRSVVEHIANKATNPIPLGSISDKLKGQTLTRGKVMFGKASDYIRQIAKSYDLHFYMDDGRLHLISMDELPEGEIFELGPESGLIGTPTQSDYGISGQCLLNPQIKLNSLIHIDNSLVRAKQIDINGSNSVPGSTASDTSGSDNNSSVRSKIISEAKRLCDDPNVRYKYGGRGETENGITYYDCSGFTMHCYQKAKLEINPTSELQYAQCNAKGLTNIDIKAAIAGDLVFWNHNGDVDHVAIYGGNNDVYAARSANKSADEQVSYGPIYGDYTIGRPRPLIDVDGGELPSANINNSSSNANNSAGITFRGLDKDGIYRVIKLTYEGDTRGNSWYVNFETVDQFGGVIPSVAN